MGEAKGRGRGETLAIFWSGRAGAERGRCRQGGSFPFLCLSFSSGKLTPILLGCRGEHPCAMSLKGEESLVEEEFCGTNASPGGRGQAGEGAGGGPLSCNPDRGDFEKGTGKVDAPRKVFRLSRRQKKKKIKNRLVLFFSLCFPIAPARSVGPQPLASLLPARCPQPGW